MLSKEFLEQYKGKQPKWGFNGLGYVVYKRTYARKKDDGTTEEWHETCERVVNWVDETHQKIGVAMPRNWYEKLYDYMFNLKGTVSGRLLWQAGTSTVDKLGGASLCNCWAVVADSKQSFLNVFDYLMLGGGVGFNMQKEHVLKLPKIKEVKYVTKQDNKDADFITPDTREGWVSLLDKLFTSYFESGKSFTYSTHLIREYGADIKGFGGTASGPAPLVTMIEKIQSILNKKVGAKLEPIDVLDIMNCIGECVVAGNVRRSSEIALGDVDDIAFLEAKQWSKGVPNHRSMSNNTVICNDIEELTDKFWESYEVDKKTGMGMGEPYGLFNLEAARKQGRTGDYNYNDTDAMATNPCGEITLAPSKGDGGAESCNLVEIFLNNIKDEEEFKDVAKTLYIVGKTVTLVDYHVPETDKIVKANSRIGIGITGIYQRADLIKPEVLTNVYNELRSYDVTMTELWNVRPSIKLTTVKPSGTLSLLAGATPGAHPDHSKYYIRRVRMHPDDKLVDMCKEAGYPVEYIINNDGTVNTDLVAVSFPIDSESGTVKKEDITAIDHLDMVKHLQRYWSDNQVSVTVDYKPEELTTIKRWLKKNYNDNIKSLSFLLFQNSGFKQQPLEEIPKGKFFEMIGQIKDIDFEQTVEEDTLAEGLECSGGACPIR
jgi:ribonucleotide reductase alpha subunit